MRFSYEEDRTTHPCSDPRLEQVNNDLRINFLSIFSIQSRPLKKLKAYRKMCRKVPEDPETWLVFNLLWENTPMAY